MQGELGAGGGAPRLVLPARCSPSAAARPPAAPCRAARWYVWKGWGEKMQVLATLIPLLGWRLLAGHHGDHELAKSALCGLLGVLLLNDRDNMQALMALLNMAKWRHLFKGELQAGSLQGALSCAANLLCRGMPLASCRLQLGFNSNFLPLLCLACLRLAAVPRERAAAKFQALQQRYLFWGTRAQQQPAALARGQLQHVAPAASNEHRALSEQVAVRVAEQAPLPHGLDLRYPPSAAALLMELFEKNGRSFVGKMLVDCGMPGEEVGCGHSG